MKKTTAIILGGGKGTRLGGDVPKQFLDLEDKMIIEHTLTTFQNCNLVDSIIVVSIESHMEKFEEIVANNNYTKVKKIVVGGDTRQDSVGNGLEFVNTEYVIVHDGVRPFVTSDNIRDVITSVDKNGSGVLAVQSIDSLKLCENMEIKATLDRSTIWAMQTPQGFTTDMLKRAHFFAKKEGYVGTDDSELVERIEEGVKIVEGSYDNIKITTKYDLQLGIGILMKKR